MKANGTHAKEIALYFLGQTGVERATSALIGRSIKMAKHILEAGYSKDEVIMTIDYIISKGVKMYSLGYVSASIADVLREMEEQKTKQQASSVTEQLAEQLKQDRKAVTSDGERAKRNAEKARRLSVQSRFRKKHNFDMFEE